MESPARLCRPSRQASRGHPRGKPGFSTFESGYGRETDSPLEGTGFEPSVPPRTERPWGGPKSILAISDLTLGGSTDRADVPIGNAQQSLLQQRDRWFESGSLHQRVRPQ